jgi:hypothetical protein
MNYDINDPSLYRDIIVLYCPQKVGSTSLVSSIRLFATDKFFVFHTHDNNIFTSPDNNNNLTVQNILKNNYRKIYIIDIFRTPIERKISEFFEELVILHFNNLPENLINYPLEKIIKRFNDIFPYISTIDYYKDIYNIPFPKEFDFENKYISYTSNNITWIKLRLQDSLYWSEILTKIFGTEIKIIKDYETQHKLTSELYKKFKNEYKLPYNYYKLMEENDELNFYLNYHEKNDYLNKWINNNNIYIPFSKYEFDFYIKISNENKFYDLKKSGHYFDNGCSCNNCFENRKLIIEDIKNHENNFDIKKYKPILHNFNSEYKSNIFIKYFYENDKIIDMIYTVF